MFNFQPKSRMCWLILLLILFVRCLPAQVSSQPIVWQPWSDEVFAQATREHKFVLLDLEASWCHWCHAMDQQTYNDLAVRQLMEKSYIAVKVDQSFRPDISNRYHGYDLPATVIFNADGSEIVRQQGYLPARQMASILQAVIDDPSPGPSVTPEPVVTYATTPFFSQGLLAAVITEFESQYDVPDQGWAFGVKYLDADSVEYASVLARRGNKLQERRVLDALQVAQMVLDPVWGGAYQSLVVAVNIPDRNHVSPRYTRIQIAGRLDSTGESWNEPHFEKLLSVQAQFIRIYSRSYVRWHAAEYLAAAEKVHHYVRDFLTDPEGAFYVSQDAEIAEGNDRVAYFALDDAMRRASGLPQVDRHLYARENGWMINALCELYAVTDDATTLAEAEQSASWVITHRSLEKGGFSHSDHDPAGPYLGDTLAMGQAFLALYEVTADREWLKRAQGAGEFITANFSAGSDPGLVTSKTSTDRAYKTHPDRDENAQLARFANLLARYTGDKGDEETAARAMRYLATWEIATAELSAPVLLAETQFTRSPQHITVVGGKNDAAAQALFRAALSTGLAYKRVEWWDPAEGPLLRADVQCPPLTHAAAFVSAASTCSSPISDPQVLEALSAKASE